jgi:hypothetical protein
MRIFYSGHLGNCLPEEVIRKRRPYVMLTFYEIREGNSATRKRFKRHRVKLQAQGRKPEAPP